MHHTTSHGFIASHEHLIPEVRSMIDNGKKPSVILRHLVISKGVNNKPSLMALFREASKLPLSEVSCIGGWWHEGKPELEDAHIDKLLTDAMTNHPPQ